MPQIPTVYLLLNEEKIVYVGQTKNLRLRMAQHANSSKKARLNYNRIAFATPQIVSPHNRLVLESVITTMAIPPGNQVVALRRTRYGCWVEIVSLRWSSYKGKERGDE
jgi:excinuclease UvrABC nuclease subunit